MKVKVFYPNKNDKIEFTRKELEDLLDEIYNEGYADGEKKHYWWTYTTPTCTSNGPTGITVKPYDFKEWTTTTTDDKSNKMYYTTTAATPDTDVAYINNSNATTTITRS